MKYLLLLAALLLASPVMADPIIIVEYPLNMTVDEGGGIELTVEVRCNVQPTSNVWVTLSCPQPLDEVAVYLYVPPPAFPVFLETKSVVFTPSDYSTKYIKLRGYPDTINDGLQSWQVVAIVEDSEFKPCLDERFCSYGPWYGNGQTCDDDGGDDGECSVE